VTDEHHARCARRLRRSRHPSDPLIAAWFNYINRVAGALGVGTT
jgi:hypothetical protein